MKITEFVDLEDAERHRENTKRMQKIESIHEREIDDQKEDRRHRSILRNRKARHGHTEESIENITKVMNLYYKGYTVTQISNELDLAQKAVRKTINENIGE